jgi:ABC-type methionine transport system ATPase subunit
MNLRLEQVCKRYPGANRLALDGVSLELAGGQMIGICGDSLAGKTTLLRIAAGRETPSSGSVSYNGVALQEMSRSEQVRHRRREIASVWAAEPWQEQLSVLEHVEMPLLVDRLHYRSAERRAREALLACEAEQCAGMAGEELSDGQRQRVELARALVSQPRLLVADGPTSRLSSIEGKAIMALLRSVAREAGTAVLLADSDADALVGVDEIFCLLDGRLVNDAETRELARLYRLPRAASRPAAAADA